MNQLHQKSGNHLKKTVLEKIKKGEVRMRPKFYFLLKVLILLFVIACTLVLSAYLVSYMFFSIRVSGKFLLFGYGTHGILTFFGLFPWVVFLLDVLLVVLLEYLIKRFQFGYHRPAVYLFLVIAFVSFCLGFIMSTTSINENLYHQNKEMHLPVLENFYGNVTRPSDKRDVFNGIISQKNGDRLVISSDDHDSDQDDGVRNVVLPPGLGADFNVGDRVFVAGDLFDDEIHAYGISKIGVRDLDESEMK